MLEVEAKVAITKQEYNRLLKELTSSAKSLGVINKKDTYFADVKKDFIRVREQDDGDVFTLKKKAVRKSVETNQEVEWGIKDKKGFKSLLKKSGILPSRTKDKKTHLFKKGKFSIELNTVKGLGHFLEIEILTISKKDVAQNKKALYNLFATLGFSPYQFEKKYYLDLLAEK